MLATYYRLRTTSNRHFLSTIPRYSPTHYSHILTQHDKFTFQHFDPVEINYKHPIKPGLAP